MSEFLDQFDKVPLSQKLLLLVLLMLGVFVAYFFLFSSKMDEQIQNERRRTNDLMDRRAELRAGTDDIERIRAEIQELCTRQATFLEKLPPREEIPSLLQSINQQGELTGLEIKRFERNENMPGINYTTIPVSMTLEGTYDQIADFFYFIGRQQRIVNVSNIGLRVNRSANPWRIQGGGTGAERGVAWMQLEEIGPPTLQVECLLNTYYADASSMTGGDACAE